MVIFTSILHRTESLLLEKYFSVHKDLKFSLVVVNSAL